MLNIKVLNFINQISIWVLFQLSAIFLVGLPFTILIWAIKKGNKAIKKLLSNYWRVSTLFFISLILFIGEQNQALLIMNIANILMTLSAWLWTDINAELREYQLWHPLSLVTKIWRWALTFVTIFLLMQSLSDISCFYSISSENCSVWFEPSENLYQILKQLFNFLFGANFSPPIAKFLGLFSLFIYSLGIIQWLVIQLPKSGRNSGFANYEEY